MIYIKLGNMVLIISSNISGGDFLFVRCLYGIYCNGKVLDNIIFGVKYLPLFLFAINFKI